jgi:glycosyltransferase involved in cell wall biosynthesis
MRFAVDARRIRSQMSGLGMYSCNLINGLARVSGAHHMIVYILKESIDYLNPPEPWETRVIVSWPPDNHLQGEYWKHVLCPKDLKRRSVDVFHDTAFQLPVRKINARSVVTIHDLTPFRMPETNSLKYNIYWRSMIKRAITSADRIVTHSLYIKEEIMERFNIDGERIEPVYLAPNPRFSPGQVDPDVLGRLELKNPYVLITANMEPRKNLVRYLQAFAELVQDSSIHHTLVVAGRFGWKCKPILRTIQRYNIGDHVKFTGYLPDDDLVHLIRGADLVAVPSLYEGFGLPVLEAMACGTPVVASRSSSLPELGRDCVGYFDPMSPASMAQKTFSVLTDQRLSNDMAARGIVRSGLFSWTKTAHETLEVYLRAYHE